MTTPWKISAGNLTTTVSLTMSYASGVNGGNREPDDAETSLSAAVVAAACVADDDEHRRWGVDQAANIIAAQPDRGVASEVIRLVWALTNRLVARVRLGKASRKQKQALPAIVFGAGYLITQPEALWAQAWTLAPRRDDLAREKIIALLSWVTDPKAGKLSPKMWPTMLWVGRLLLGLVASGETPLISTQDYAQLRQKFLEKDLEWLRIVVDRAPSWSSKGAPMSSFVLSFAPDGSAADTVLWPVDDNTLALLKGLLLRRVQAANVFANSDAGGYYVLNEASVRRVFTIRGDSREKFHYYVDVQPAAPGPDARPSGIDSNGNFVFLTSSGRLTTPGK